MAKRLDHVRIVDEVRRQIITRIIPAGAALDENRLADDLRVSRTPIREVAHELAGAGLLKREAACGFRTPIFGLAEIIAHFQALDALLGPAIPLTAEMRRDDDLMAMAADLETLQLCVESRVMVEFRMAARDFLTHCAKSTHNDAVASVLEMLFDQHAMIRADFCNLVPEAIQYEQMNDRLQIYQQMYRLIEAGNPSGLRAVAQEQIAASRRFVFEQFSIPGLNVATMEPTRSLMATGS